MEEKAQHTTSQFIPDINFYRYAVFTILNQAKNPALTFNQDQLRMNKNQFRHALSFTHSLYHRPIKPEELMFIDSFCENATGSLSNVAIDELLLDDEHIADAYAKLMALRHRKDPAYDTRPTVRELFELILEASDGEEDRRFSYSELNIFSSGNDKKSKLECIADSCAPVYSHNGVCIGKKTLSRNQGLPERTAIVYASGEQSTDSFYGLLASDAFIFSSATADFCKTLDCFRALIQKYDDFFIAPKSLPELKSERYAGRDYTKNELSTAKLCEAFFTEETFGKEVLLIHGSKSAVKKLCDEASARNLSVFSDVFALKKAKKAYRRSDRSGLVKIKSKLFNLLGEMRDNLSIALPGGNAADCCADGIIPRTAEIYRDGNDCFISSSLSLSSATLPFHSAFCALIAPTARALSLRKEPGIGQITLSLNATLCFSDPQSAAISLSALLGIYDAATRLSIPIVNSDLMLTDGDSIGLTVTAHDFSERIKGSEDNEESLRRLLLENLDVSRPDNVKDLDFIVEILRNARQNAQN